VRHGDSHSRPSLGDPVFNEGIESRILDSLAPGMQDLKSLSHKKGAQHNVQSQGEGRRGGNLVELALLGGGEFLEGRWLLRVGLNLLLLL